MSLDSIRTDIVNLEARLANWHEKEPSDKVNSKIREFSALLAARKRELVETERAALLAWNQAMNPPPPESEPTPHPE